MPANPFPDCVCEAEAMLIIGYMIGTIILMLFLIVLMLYFYKSISNLLPTLVLFLFSIVFGMLSFSGSFLPFTPYIQLLFILIQTVFFYMKIDEKGWKNLWR